MYNYDPFTFPFTFRDGGEGGHAKQARNHARGASGGRAAPLKDAPRTVASGLRTRRKRSGRQN